MFSKQGAVVAITALAARMAVAAATPGVVGTDFAGSLKYAEENGVPIVVMWGNTSCDYCDGMKAVLESAEVAASISKSSILVVVKDEVPGSKSTDYNKAYSWLKNINSKLTQYPFVGFYWKKPGGAEVRVAATGRLGKLPVTKGKTLTEQFLNTIDDLFAGYHGGVTPQPVPGGDGDWTLAEFKMAGTAYDRLEAEPWTTSVFVPLKRAVSAARSAGKVQLEVYAPGVKVASESVLVKWAAGEAEKAVKIAVVPQKAGKKTMLRLIGKDGAVLETAYVNHVAEQENSPKNPHWVGEQTAESLPYGEWTMDFDVARRKVALYGGKLLAMFGGPLWCPNCVAIEEGVFSQKKFKTWAKKNRIVLVHFDQGEASSPSTAAGTTFCRLLTTDAAVDHIDGSVRSGVSYLSRHGIDPGSATVKAVINRVTELTDEWLAPESTAARLGNPTVLLLNDDGTSVDARFVRQNDKYDMDLTENMHRLADLMTLAGDDELNGYVSTTSLRLAAGETVRQEFHINSRVKVYALTGLSGDYIRATVAEKSKDIPMALELWKKGGTAALASGAGTLVAQVGPQGEYFLRAVAYGAAVGSTFFGKDTSFAASIKLESGDETMAATVAFKSVGKAEAVAANGNVYAQRTFVVPLRTATDGGSVVAGTLTVKQTSGNKLSATYAGTASKGQTLTGSWNELNLMTGVATTVLAKGGTTLALALDASGKLSAELVQPSGSSPLGETLVGEGAEGLASKDAAAFVGLYTVTLPDVSKVAGTAVLSLNVAKSGKVSWSGYLPNGTRISGSSSLTAKADGSAGLAVCKRTSKDFFAAEFVLAPNAAETWGAEGEMGTVAAPDGVHACHLGAEGQTLFEVYGGYWQKNATPLGICEMFGLSPTIDFCVAGEAVGQVLATKGGFSFARGGAVTSFSFTKSTGLFSGKATVNGVKGTFRGVLLPGWIDCGCTGEPVVERPYGSGSFTAKGITLSIDLIAGKAGK